MTEPKCKTTHWRDGVIVDDVFRVGDRVDIHVDGFGTLANVGSTRIASEISDAIRQAYRRGRADKLAQINHILSQP